MTCARISEFVHCSHPENRRGRAESERFKCFSTMSCSRRQGQSGHLLPGTSADSANLPDPDILALKKVEELEAALEQLATVAEDLKACVPLLAIAHRSV
jgi:hypothetical protein